MRRGGRSRGCSRHTRSRRNRSIGVLRRLTLRMALVYSGRMVVVVEHLRMGGSRGTEGRRGGVMGR